MSLKYEPVIGLEVHVQLKTRSKLFCSCRQEFGAIPNQNTCPVCLGLPGTLPVLNEVAFQLGARTGLALDCKISGLLKFDRKNYFYPDLPKGYQISQFDNPVAYGGQLKIDVEGGYKIIGITRGHLEEDAGKLLHEGSDGSVVDFNRAGIPLLEIVSEPDLRNPDEAHAYLTALKAILRYVGVSDCDMEKGSLRCDANVSIRPVGREKFGTKVEIKNLNSFSNVRKALIFEIERQTEALDNGETINQETRLWNEAKGMTATMRSKEDAHDYRYFPEPDLVPFTVEKEWVEAIRVTLPELPRAKKERLVRDFGLSDYDAGVLTQEQEIADYFENVLKAGVSAKLASNWLTTELLGRLNVAGLTFENSPISAASLASLIGLIEKGTISGKIAKDVFDEMMASGKDPSVIVQEKGWVQVSDESAIAAAVDLVIAANPKPAEDFRSGKDAALKFMVGMVMKEMRGKGNPAVVNKILMEKLRS